MTYDDLTVKIGESYDLFLFSLTGRYLSLTAPGVEITPNVIVRMQDDAFRFAQSFYSSAETEIDNYLRPMLEDASDELTSGLVTRKKHLLALIRVATTENVMQLVRQAKVSGHNYADLLRDAHGAIGLLVQKQAGTIDFKIHDTANRKWSAGKLVKFMVRDFAYQSWLDFSFDSIKRDGDLALVRHANSERDFVLSITSETAGYPSLREIREKVFHPNATALVEPYTHVSSE